MDAARRESAEPLVPRQRASLCVGREEVLLGPEETYLGPLRAALGISDDFLKDNVNFDTIAPGGGKGGDSMCWSLCGQWLVKELGDGDKASLCDPQFLTDYCAYLVRQRERSLLARIVCVFCREHKQQWYHVMNNWLPSDTKWTALYDLKGNRDDKLLVYEGERVTQIHKRFWMVGWLCAECMPSCRRCCEVPPDRQQYAEGKRLAFNCRFHLTPKTRRDLMGSLRSDCEFLRAKGLMDYSLICGVARYPASEVRQSASPGRFFATPVSGVQSGYQWVYYLGLIDFLQSWNTRKKLAHVVKLLFAPKPISTVEPHAYANQFLRSFERRFLADADEVPRRVGFADGGAVPATLPSSMSPLSDGMRVTRCPLLSPAAGESPILSPRREVLHVTVMSEDRTQRQRFRVSPREDVESLSGAIRGAFGLSEEDELVLRDEHGGLVRGRRILAQNPSEYWVLHRR
eukprot:TRINITY_DN6964_c3_g1_i1.p1 TRINITY_DN6964_c3_g1~~TRINITY_DN6964_c3_g1_i1.p1  ORF type:complete len:459 (+),score=64.30 TRINITY_DN6964_c3_g1_i1:86-1462(+)